MKEIFNSILSNRKVFTLSVIFGVSTIMASAIFVSVYWYGQSKLDSFMKKVEVFAHLTVRPNDDVGLVQFQRLILEDTNKGNIQLSLKNSQGAILMEIGSPSRKLRNITINLMGHDYLFLDYSINYKNLIKNYMYENFLIYLIIILSLGIFLSYILLSNYYFIKKFNDAAKILNRQIELKQKSTPLTDRQKKYFGKSFNNLFQKIEMLIDSFVTHEKFMLNEKKQQELAHQALSIAHDLRSPLSALRIAQDCLPENTNPEVKMLIRRSSERMLSLTEELLRQRRSLNNSETTNCNLIFDISKLEECLNRIISDFKIRDPSLNIVLANDIDNHMDLMIPKGISVLDFERSICNLVENSIDARHSYSKIKIHLRMKENSLQVLVVDNGNGIPLNIVKQLNKKNFSYGKRDGNGLGLSQVKLFCRNYGFSFKLYSKLKLGTIAKLSVIVQKNTLEPLTCMPVVSEIQMM